MAASYLGTCFATVAEARTAHCLGGYPLSSTAGAEPVSVACVGTSEAGLMLVQTTPTATTEVTLPTSYADCNAAAILSAVPTPALAAQAFAWGFSLVLIGYCTAWGVRRVLRMVGR